MSSDRTLHTVFERMNQQALSCSRISAGKNSRVFDVPCASGAHYVVKCYSRPTAQGRCRRTQEWGAFSFLRGEGIAAVPEPVATFPQENLSVFSHLPGEPVGRTTQADVLRLVDFLDTLHGVGQKPGARGVSHAEDACFTLEALVANVSERASRLRAVAEQDGVTAEMLRWLRGEFSLRFDAAAQTAREKLPDAAAGPLPLHCRLLSPSDFGFHNALRNPAGGFYFFDFEYFGWDDPVKTIADVILHPHPAMQLPADQYALFYRALRRMFSDDAQFDIRFDCFFPLYRLKWCTILLNEFIASRLVSRHFAQESALSDENIKSIQLHKAISLLRQDDGSGSPSQAYL